MKTPKPKTLYRLFVTRFHSPRLKKNPSEKGKQITVFRREQLVHDMQFESPKAAREWVETHGNPGSELGWCELWGDAIPVSEVAKCERVRLEFERYEEVPLLSEEQDAQIRSESLRALHA